MNHTRKSANHRLEICGPCGVKMYADSDEDDGGRPSAVSLGPNRFRGHCGGLNISYLFICFFFFCFFNRRGTDFRRRNRNEHCRSERVIIIVLHVTTPVCVGRLKPEQCFDYNGFDSDFVGVGFRKNIMVSIFDIAHRDVISISIWAVSERFRGACNIDSFETIFDLKRTTISLPQWKIN